MDAAAGTPLRRRITMNTAIETKVKAGTAASAAAGLILWALSTYVFKGDVPDVVTSWTYAIVPAAITFGAGYFARHTSRPAAAAPAPEPPPSVSAPPEPPQRM